MARSVTALIAVLASLLALLGFTLPAHTPNVASCQSMFDAKSDSTWAVADGNAAVRLRDGRLAWLFGDTWRIGAPFVRNTLLVQEGQRLTSPTGGQAIPNDGSYWFWPSDGILDGGALRVFAGRVVQIGDGPFGFSGRGTALVTFRLDWRGYPIYQSRRMINLAEDDIGWGAAVVRRGSWLYVYGQRAKHGLWIFGRDVFVARVPAGSLVDLTAWRYWNGSSWVRDRARAAVVEHAETGRFASAFTVDLIDGEFVAVSKEADFLGHRIIAMRATSPVGPFEISGSLDAPSTDAVWTYQARAHPELPLDSGRLLVTWNEGGATSHPKPICGEISWR